MKSNELEALRRLLFFSAPEAAALVGGVSEQAWRRWEAGTRTIPEDVSRRLRGLADWRRSAVSAGVDQINGAPPGSAVSVVWYATLDDWASLSGREPVFWRPQQSVVAALAGEFPGRVDLVLFSGTSYAAWLSGRQDNETARSQWAAGG